MTKDECDTMLQLLAAAYRVELDPMTNDVWNELMHDVPLSLGMQAARRWMTTSNWFPKPAELMRDVQQLQRADELSHERERRQLAAFRCDGSRWVPLLDDEREPTGDMRPCSTCNGFLHELWQDEHKWKAWRQGHRFTPPEGMPMDTLPCEQPPPYTASENTARANIAALKATMASWTKGRRG